MSESERTPARRIVALLPSAAALLAIAWCVARVALPLRDAPRHDPPAPDRVAHADEATEAVPRLVLLIVIDQFRADYLVRFDEHFGERGFRRLEREGAVFEEARYRHATLMTGPGHATIATGGHAHGNGIVANTWIDRSTKLPYYCVEDASAPQLSGKPHAAGVSPRCLLCSTFGDELVKARPASRVVTISLKDRSAALLGGRRGRAFWWDGYDGIMTSSRFYGDALPAWADAWNAAAPAEKLRGATWELSMPAAAYASCEPDDAPWEMELFGHVRTFPHRLPGAGRPIGEIGRAIIPTPFGNEVILDFVRTALRAEKLGARAGTTDVLAVSFSSNDYVGHVFGQDSYEVMDMTVRTDKQIEALLDEVEKDVGLDHALVVLTSDHGCTSCPERLTTQGFACGRIAPDHLAEVAAKALETEFGAGERLVTAYQVPGLYFDRPALERRKIPLEAAQRVVARAFAAEPGIAFAFTAEDLARGIAPETPEGRAVQLSYEPKRSGDVITLSRPGWYLDEDPNEYCATHGSPWSDDMHVPLILRGPAARAGKYTRRVSPADIAPTITAILRVERPSACDGEPLWEALVGR